MTPLDRYQEIRKTADGALGRAAHGFASAFTPERFGGAVGASALAAGAMGLGAAAQKIVSAITKQRDFRRMIELSPDLVEERDRNPERFNQQYSSLRRLNPMFAQDPVIAGTYMRQMSLAPETAGKVLVESLGSMPKPQGAPPWLEAGTREFGAGGPRPPLQQPFGAGRPRPPLQQPFGAGRPRPPLQQPMEFEQTP